MTDLYIYYRVRDELAEAFAPRVQAMQQALCAASGVTAQLKRRPASRDGMQTWMEVYAAASPGFESRLADAVAQAGLAGSIDGERHTEVFTDISPCA